MTMTRLMKSRLWSRGLLGVALAYAAGCASDSSTSENSTGDGTATTMDAMDDVPGPRVRGHGNWMVWYFVIMFVASIAQLGGIVGGVGQALQISVPLTEDGRRYNEIVDARMTLKVEEATLRSLQLRLRRGDVETADVLQKQEQVHALGVVHWRLRRRERVAAVTRIPALVDRRQPGAEGQAGLDDCGGGEHGEHEQQTDGSPSGRGALAMER